MIHSESVYALIGAPKAAPPVVPPRDVTEYATYVVPPTASTLGLHNTSVVVGNAGGNSEDFSVHPLKQDVATIGRVVSDTINPKNFLKKGDGSGGMVVYRKGNMPKRRINDHNHDKVRPPVPNRHDRPIHGLKSDKNFVVANAVENIIALPRNRSFSPEPRAVNYGNFGKIPKYLTKIKKEIAHEYACVDNYEAQRRQEEKRFSELESDEITQIRADLQHRWNTLNTAYQTAGFMVRSLARKQWRDQVEADLQATQWGLSLLNHDTIYVFDDTKGPL